MVEKGSEGCVFVNSAECAYGFAFRLSGKRVGSTLGFGRLESGM